MIYYVYLLYNSENKISGFAYPKPLFDSSVYNSAFFLALDPSVFLSYEYPQTLYLSESDYRLSYITGITPSVATAGVALVLSNNLCLTGLGAISYSSLATPSITVVNMLSAAQVNISGPNGYLTIKDTRTNGRATINFSNDTRNLEIGLRGSANSDPRNGFYVYGNIVGYQLIISASGNVGIGTNVSPTLKLDGMGNVNTTTAYRLNGALLTFDAIQGISAGTAAPSKALVLDAPGNITGINSISLTTALTGYQSLLSASNITVITQTLIGSADASVGTQSNHPCVFMSNNTRIITTFQNGNVMVGPSTDQGYKLHVGGSVNTTIDCQCFVGVIYGFVWNRWIIGRLFCNHSE